MMKHGVSAVFGMALVLFTLSSVSAAPPPGLEKYMQAQAAFRQMMDDAKAGKGEVPRLSDPKAAEVLRTLSDVDGVLGTQTYEWADFFSLFNMCKSGLAYSYISIGAPPYPRPRAGMEPETSEVREERMETGKRNLALYQDEITPLAIFSLACQSRLFPFFDEMASRFGQRKASPFSHMSPFARLMGFQAMVFANFMTFTIVINQPEMGVRSENRLRLLKAGAMLADNYAGSLSEGHRKNAIEEAEKLRPTLEATAQTDLDIIIKAMQRTECEGLCAFRR